MSHDLIYRYSISPPGCACAECGEPFADGERYSQRVTAVAADATFVEILCWSCAVGDSADAAP